jgi:hypothetical protein
MRYDEKTRLDDQREMAFNDACQQDYGRKDEPIRTIANIVICGQCPYYQHTKSGSLCRGKRLRGYCIPNECLKAVVDNGDWSRTPDEILEYVKEKITEAVQ